MFNEGNFFIGLILGIIVMFLMLYDSLLLLQQNHYHYDFIKKYFLKIDNKFDIVVIFLSLLRFIEYKGLFIIFDYIILFCYVVYIIYWFKRKRILKLKFTSRILRILMLSLILSILEGILLDFRLIIVLTCPNVFLALIMLEPIQNMINNYYITKAKEKIKRIKPLVIGITGSAGKTSVKNFLYQLLKNERVTFMTPKSYNTVMGLCKAINEGLKDGTEIVILEYGASKKGDIDKLLDVVKPDVGLITNVLPQHLETFKSVENIMEEKFKLLKASSIAVLNIDVIDTILPDNIKKITISSKKDANFNVKDIVINEVGCSFNINGISFKSSLLGKCNYENIVIAVAACLYLNIKINNLIFNVKNLTSVENRLEVVKINHNMKYITIINDSFNSNIKGFRNALEVIGYFKNDKKAIITPGIVEGGKREEEINRIVSKKIIDSHLRVYIVRSNAAKYMIREFEERKYEYEVFESFQDAYNKALDNNEVILIENDISDIYK